VKADRAYGYGGRQLESWWHAPSGGNAIECLLFREEEKSGRRPSPAGERRNHHLVFEKAMKASGMPAASGDAGYRADLRGDMKISYAIWLQWRKLWPKASQLNKSSPSAADSMTA